MGKQNKLLSGGRINPPAVADNTSLVDLVERTFLSYNAGRLREACQIYAWKMLKENVTIGVSLAGALTPSGLGASCLVPLMERGFIDWIVATGANLYHDIHFALGLQLRQGSPFCDDAVLREEGVVRIYDILFDYQVLLKTDAFLKRVFAHDEFQKEMGTAELHYRLGQYVHREEEDRGTKGVSILAAAYRLAIPVYTPSPGDSSIGMNVAALALSGNQLKIDVNLDVNETAAIVYGAKRAGGKSGVMIIGGGSPKNFLLQTEPQIQEVLGLRETGHDYFIQVTDARPDTGGLSGATPSEAISWGKVNPEGLPDAVVAYLDSTIALPIITAYVLNQSTTREQKALYEKRVQLNESLKRDYLQKRD